MLNRGRALLVLQVTVATVALGYVLWLVDWRHAIEALRHANLLWLAGAFALLLLGFLPAALRWTALLQALGIRFGRMAAYRAYLTGAFYGLAMPGVIGGDAARAWSCLRKTDAPLTLIAGTVLAERVLGVVALLLILTVGISLYPAQGSGVHLEWVPGAAIMLVAGMACLPWILRRMSLPTGSPNPRCHGSKEKLPVRALKQLAPIKRLSSIHLLVGLTLSIAFQFCDILATYAIGQALGLELSMLMLLIAMPIVYLATVLPISPGGLGVREATLVIILAQSGLSGADAALLAVTVFLNRVAVGIVGAGQHLAGGTGDRA